MLIEIFPFKILMRISPLCIAVGVLLLTLAVVDASDDLEKKFFDCLNLVKKDDWSSLSKKYSKYYKREIQSLQNQYSFDKEELEKRINLINYNYKNSFFCAKNPYDKNQCQTFRDADVSLRSFVKMLNALFTEKARYQILEKKTIKNMFSDYKRMVVKINYSNNNEPFYFSYNTSCLSAGLYKTKDEIVIPHKKCWNVKLDQSNTHLLKEVIIFVEHSPTWDDLVPNVRIYSLLGADGFSFKRDLQ